ncbi:hypothetical protein IWW48_005854 [Coemansia sp. RSA 1200]|nr:hypothetical protein IWW48_005854 [Coemansia sp. RSA 1200]
MKILSLYLLVSTALAQSQTSSVAVSVASSVEADASIFQNNPSTQSGNSIEARPESNAYTPFFDFDMAPYNVAMDIVAEALEKLADTMEPLDLPLPLVGPGYYLEVMVKSSKSPHSPQQQQQSSPSPSPLPLSQINGINIEGGEALPVTQIEIIFPGESIAQETFKLSSSDLAEFTVVESNDIQNTAGNISAPEPIPETGEETQLQSVIPAQESTGSLKASPTSDKYSSASNTADSITHPGIGELVSDGSIAGQPTGHMSIEATGTSQGTEPSIISGSQLAQPVSPESIGPMSTVSGLESIPDGIPASAVENGISGDVESIIGFGFGFGNTDSVSSGSDETSETVMSQASGEIEMPEMSSGQTIPIAYSPIKPEKSASPEDHSSDSTNEDEEWGTDIIDGINGSVSSSSNKGTLDDTLFDATKTEENISTTKSSEEAGPSSSYAYDGNTDFFIPSSAPILVGSSNVAADMNQAESRISQSEAARNTAEPDESIIEEDSVASEAMDTFGITMASAPLPFPPFGDPHQQQQELPTAQSAEATLNMAVESAPTSFVESEGVMETIDIVDASNRNVLESSIDAILHSVMDEYETESIPKAAVGFALIHPRRE